MKSCFMATDLKYYELELYVPPLSVVVLRYDYKAE